MYQNTINSPYPIVNPVQMQAPVTVNMPAAAPVSVAQSPAQMPAPMQAPMPMPMPMQKAPVMRQNLVADDLNLYNNADVLLRVQRAGDDKLHISSARPVIMDGITYCINKNGTLESHSGWTGMKTIVENCPIMADLYSKLAFSLSLNEDSYNRARQAGMIK